MVLRDLQFLSEWVVELTSEPFSGEDTLWSFVFHGQI